MAANWLDALIALAVGAIAKVYSGGSLVTPSRPAVEYKGAGVGVADNPVTGRTDVTIPGVAGSFDVTVPAAVGAASAVGVSTSIPRRDHVHAHGNQTVDTQHARAVAGVSHGFFDKADKRFLDALHSVPGVDLTNGDETIVIGGGSFRRMPSATSGRNKTLSTTGAVAGDIIAVLVTDTSANTVAFINGGAGAGSLFTSSGVIRPNLVAFLFNGTDWILFHADDANLTYLATSDHSGFMSLGDYAKLAGYPTYSGLLAFAIGTAVDAGAPSGLTSGSSDRVAIQTILTAGLRARLRGGATYIIDRPLVLTSGSGIFSDFGGPIARIRQGSDWTGTGVNSQSNSFVTCFDTENGATTTVATADRASGAPSIDIAASASFTAGKYYKAVGVNAAGHDFYGQSASSGAPAEELLRIASKTSNTLTHGLPQSKYHGLGKTLKLLDACVDGASIEHVFFDAYDASNTLPRVAGAVAGTFARRITIDRCAWKGVLAYGVWLDACREVQVRDSVDKGFSNGGVFLPGCENGYVHNVRKASEDPDAALVRTNTFGSAKAWAYFGWAKQPQNLLFEDCDVQCAAMAYVGWGGVNCSMVNCNARDIDATLVLTDSRYDTSGTMRASCIDQGSNDLTIAAFGFGCSWVNCHFENAHHGTVVDVVGGGGSTPGNWCPHFYVHDHAEQFFNVVYDSKGRSPSDAAAGSYVGARFQDCTGRIDLMDHGNNYGLVGTGVYYGMTGRADLLCGAGTGATTGGGAVVMGGVITGGFQLEFMNFGGYTVLFESLSDLNPAANCFLGPVIEKLTGPLLNTVAPGVGFLAKSVVLLKFASSATIVTGIAVPFSTAITDGKRNMLTTVAAGATRAAVALDLYAGFAGTTRHCLGVVLQDGCTTPLKVLATSPLPAREPIQCDASGFGIAWNPSAIADYKTILGRLDHEETADGYHQLSGV